MPWDFQRGIAGAAEAGAGLISDRIKDERALSQNKALLQQADEMEQQKRQRIADVLNSAPSTRDLPASPETGGASVPVPLTPVEMDRSRGTVLEKAGFINEARHYFDRADRSETKDEDRKVREAQQKSADEKWREQFKETQRHNKATEARMAAQLGIKAQEKKEFNDAIDSYVGVKANFDALVASGAPKEQVDAARRGVESASLKLKQWNLSVGDQSEFAKHLNLSATLTALNKTIEAKEQRGEDASAEKQALSATVKQIASLTTGTKGGAAPAATGDVTFVRTADGKLVRSTGGATGGPSQDRAGALPGDKAQPVTAADRASAEAAAAARRLKLQQEEDERRGRQVTRGVEIDAFNRAMGGGRANQ